MKIGSADKYGFLKQAEQQEMWGLFELQKILTKIIMAKNRRDKLSRIRAWHSSRGNL